MTPRKTPARSEEDKQKEFQRIIETGRELFVSKGSYGFSTRALAKKLNMSQGNLYNYVKSKRELWIAIRNQDFKKLKNEMEQIIEEHKGDIFKLLEEIANYYLDLAKNDYRRFQMMFLIPAPPSKKVGPIEKNYKLIDPLDLIKKALKSAMEKNEIKKMDENFLSYFVYSLVQGAIFVERDFRASKIIYEPIDKNPTKEKVKSFRKFMIQQIKKLIEK
ncbi:MAG: TetR family transcriptional regulator [Candidatus Lokiarchaeota archaeon]|nr:TetR family transcriptional regulator [Candidatus Lokiarchaeota archaeon]MBD3341015.1 TetR family transcriptional regulator [Candidatus Lokiarchaeota archaeon]